MIGSIQERHFQRDAERFLAGEVCHDWLNYCSPASTDLLLERTRERVKEQYGGTSSVSAFEITFRELVSSGRIAKLRVVPENEPTIDEDAEFIAFIKNPRTASFELKRKYTTDAEFRSFYDRYTGM
jgi:hypothetical protein